MRPTGRLHLGNYFGTLKNWLEFQNKYDCLFMVADYHALTTLEDTSQLQKNILEMVLDWLSIGLDSKKCTFFVQSQVPEHTELALLLGMVTPLPLVQRNPVYKEMRLEFPKKLTFGLLGYPVLQAADILIYKAEAVPVGQDQAPHIEIAREITVKFNQTFGTNFPKPKTILSPQPKIMALTHPQKKMSKSLGPLSYIALSDSPEAIQKKLAPAVTDVARKRRTDKGHPEKCNLFGLHQLFSSSEQVKKISQGCQTAQIGCLECKKILAEMIAKEFAPFRQKRSQLEKNPGRIEKILVNGSKRARRIANQTIKEVKQKIGLI